MQNAVVQFLLCRTVLEVSIVPSVPFVPVALSAARDEVSNRSGGQRGVRGAKSARVDRRTGGVKTAGATDGREWRVQQCAGNVKADSDGAGRQADNFRVYTSSKLSS